MNKTVLIATTLAGFSIAAAHAAETTSGDAPKTVPTLSTPAASTPAASTMIPAPAAVIATTRPGDRLTSRIIGADVHAESGGRIGDVNDLVVDRTGAVTAVVVGVGGFLGVGEKSVALPYAAVTMGSDDKGKPHLVVDVSKEALEKAPAFQPAKS